MKTLKFRAWDTEENRWKEDGHGFSIHWLGAFIGSDGIAYSGRFIVEQFTGLIDRRGTEIYDGDIVDSPNHYGKCLVMYGVDINAAYVLKELPLSDKGAQLLGILDEMDIEVIGNVHENPELLKSI